MNHLLIGLLILFGASCQVQRSYQTGLHFGLKKKEIRKNKVEQSYLANPQKIVEEPIVPKIDLQKTGFQKNPLQRFGSPKIDSLFLEVQSGNFSAEKMLSRIPGKLQKSIAKKMLNRFLPNDSLPKIGNPTIKSNKNATISYAMTVASCCILPILSLPALYFGMVALKEMKDNPGKYKDDKGTIILCIVINSIITIVLLAFLVLFLWESGLLFL